jgi:hypothetical protein
MKGGGAAHRAKDSVVVPDVTLPFTDQGLLDGSAVADACRNARRRFVAAKRLEFTVHAAKLFGLDFIPQEHANGCVVSVLAMLTGRAYDDVLAEFNPQRVYLHGTNWDEAASFLSTAKGKLKIHLWGDASRAAPRYPSMLEVGMSGGVHSHAVVLLPDGGILDPLLSIVTTRAHYAVKRLFEVRGKSA